MSQPNELAARFADVGGPLQVFASKADDYARGRPTYPAALFAHVEARLGQPAPLAIADVGAGTGLFTAGWLARGHQVIAVEPNDAMRATADALLGTQAAYRSVGATAEATTLPVGCVDLVTAAQAFHWFDPLAFRAECLRILRPGGQVALVWNDRSSDAPIHLALDRIFATFGGNKRMLMTVRAAQLDGVRSFFGDHARMEQWTTEHSQVLDREGLRALVLSRSYMPGPQAEDRLAAERAIDALFDSFAAQGTVALPYRTGLFFGRPA
jgi:SAM-dependent methyltransferase